MVDMNNPFIQLAAQRGTLNVQKPDHLRTLPSEGSSAYGKMSDEQKAAVEAERARRTNYYNWEKKNRGSGKANPYAATNVRWSSGFEGGYDFEFLPGYNPNAYPEEGDQLGFGGSGMLTSQEVSTQGGGRQELQRSRGGVSTQPVGEPVVVGGGMSTQPVGAPIVFDRGSYPPAQSTPYRGGGGGDVTYGNQDVAQTQNQNFMQLLQSLGLEALLNLFQPAVYGQGGASTQSSGMFGVPENFGVAPINVGYLPPQVVPLNPADMSYQSVAQRSGMLNQI